jgi:simple sugar transport system permease protein
VINDSLPGFSVPSANVRRPTRLLDRALAWPSSAALVGLLITAALFALLVPQLVSVQGIAGILDVAATLGIGAVAVALLLVAGEFDFSIGVVSAGSALVTAVLVGEAGWGVWPALLVSLAGAVLVGLVNGVLVVNTGLPSILVTLATLLVLQGVTSAAITATATSGRVESLDDAPGWASAEAVFGSTLTIGDGRFRVSILWWVVVTALASWTLWRTRFGNALFGIGGARRAAVELGVPVRRTTVAMFCLTATAGWLIGALALVRLGAVQAVPGFGSGIDYLVVAVIGGCLVTGGWGSTLGAAAAALLYAVARQGITLAGWNPQWFEVLLGVLLLGALVANGVVRRRLKAAPRS